jgi:hypothetical protein
MCCLRDWKDRMHTFIYHIYIYNTLSFGKRDFVVFTSLSSEYPSKRMPGVKAKIDIPRSPSLRLLDDFALPLELGSGVYKVDAVNTVVSRWR